MGHLGNYEYSYDSAIYGDARYAKYSATYDNARFDLSFWDFKWSDVFDQVIRRLEMDNSIQTVSEPGTCIPGLDVICSPFLELLKRIEAEE